MTSPEVKKDYAYRSTWEHQRSRALNLARRGGLTKRDFVSKHGRLPRGREWFGREHATREEWEAAWLKEHPKR